MSILDIIQDVITESGRDDLEDNKRTVLRWLNTYKLKLQRESRVSFSANTSPIVAIANTRATDLPSDFLSAITIRRPTKGTIGVTQDLFGNQFAITKEVTLHRWLNKEAFLDSYPINREDGEVNIGAFNDYILQAGSIIWGPMPSEDETLYIDYYRLLPKYDLVDNIEDDYTTYFEDGLFNRCMEMVFTTWIPEKEKREIWKEQRLDSERGIKKYYTLREHPMESSINLPDN